MTELLRKAFREASKLSPEEQDAIASILLAELESERRWQNSFERSGELLEEMADRAIAQDEAGLTEPLNSGGS